jgi:RNA polymerase sigma-70 factor, ECF subfamily
MKDEITHPLEGLYREMGPNLLAYFTRRHSHSQVAEDLLQETFLQALKNPDRLWAAASPRAYLFGIGRHLSLAAYRRKESEEALPEQLSSADMVSPDPRLESLREAIRQLPESQNEVLELRLRHELAYEEIAQVLQIPIGTVRSRLHLAVQKLRETLNPPPVQRKEIPRL